LVLLFVPALLWLVWRGRAQLDARGVILSLAGLAVAAVPFAALLARDAGVYGMRGAEVARWALFSFEGYDFSGAFFDFSLTLFPSDLFHWVAFLVIQFVGLSALSGFVGFFQSRRTFECPQAVYVALCYAGAFAFAFAYRVGDRYAFYLPSYLPFVVWIAVGWQWLLDLLRAKDPAVVERRWFAVLLAALVLLVPVVAYRIAPELVARGMTFRDARRVPGPRAKTYFLWPPKTNYRDARVFAERALEVAPDDCLILADPILSSPLRFLQVVEGKRPDVTVRYCCWDIDDVLAEAPDRPVALADVSPEVYPVERLRADYHIRPVEPIYVLERE